MYLLYVTTNLSVQWSVIIVNVITLLKPQIF